MPYIGRSPEYGGLEKQLITADSSTTTFALTYTVGSESSILVSVAGVLQQPGSAYNLSGGGTNIVFTAAPTTGSDVFVVFLGRAYDSQNIATGAVTGLSALGTSPASADVFLMYDDDASALKKVAYSDLESDTAAMAANTVKVRDANSSGTPSNKAVADTQILIGDGTGFTAAALSGDVTMTNAGVVTIANTSVENAMMAVNSIDSDQYVDGSIDNAHLADDAVGADELAANAVVNASIASGAAIDATKIADGSVTSAEFQYISTLSSNAQTQLTAKAALATAQTFTAGQRGEITALTSATTITIDMADSNNFSVTLAHNATFANPSNDTAGQSGSIFITQDGTGSRTASWGTDWEFAGGTAPTLTTTAAAVDRIDYIIKSGTSIQAVATLAYA
jgi:hypothetical protein